MLITVSPVKAQHQTAPLPASLLKPLSVLFYNNAFVCCIIVITFKLTPALAAPRLMESTLRLFSISI